MRIRRRQLVDISGLTKAQVLAALYNAAKLPRSPLAIIRLATGDLLLIDEAKAQSIINEQGLVFDKLHGKRLYVDLTGDNLDVAGYERKRNNGTGRAIKALTKLRDNGDLGDKPKPLTEEELARMPKFVRTIYLKQQAVADKAATAPTTVTPPVTQPAAADNQDG